MSALALLLAAALQAPAAAAPAATVESGTFTSPALGRDVAYRVYLPASYAQGGRRYPVLYVLHGLFEGPDFWDSRGLDPILRGLEARGEVPELIVAAVDGGRSFFANGPLGAHEDLAVRDFPAFVEGRWRTQPGRAHRALLGVSMGGYGALRIAFAHPEAFAAVATHSAMLLLAPPTLAQGAGAWQMRAFNAAFGDPIDRELWTRADPLSWAEKADAAKTPALFLTCGAEDRYGLAAGHRELRKRLQARGVEHELALPPGDHGYEHVRALLPQSLAFVGRALKEH